MLALLGLEYKAIPVNLKEGEHREAEFLKHPFGKVPVLVDNNTVMGDRNSGLFGSSVMEMKIGCQATQNHKIMQWLSLAELITESCSGSAAS